MKKIVFVLSVSLISATLCGQQKIEVLSSAGGFNTSSDNSISISWTLGETIIPNYVSSDGTISLVHGFQSKLIVTRVIETLVPPVTVTIYPNPASEVVRIAFDSPTEKEIRLSIINPQGRVVSNEVIPPGISLKEVNMQHLPSGIYYFRLQQGIQLNVYRVVKL